MWGSCGGQLTRRFPRTSSRERATIASVASSPPAMTSHWAKTSRPISVTRMLRVERSMRRAPRSRSSSATLLLSFDLGSPVAREAAEKPPWRTTCAKYCKSFRSCNDASGLTYRFPRGNSVSSIRCLQVALSNGRGLVLASTWEAGDANAEMRDEEDTWIYNNPDTRVG